MDIKVNSVNFTGKKEVLYALTKAAQKAKDYEFYRQPAIAMRMTTDTLQASQNASMKAYIDMALRDSEFKNVVKGATNKDLSYIKNILAPERTDYSLIEPMKKFSETINEVVINDYGSRAQESMTAYVSELLQKLKL